VRWAEGNDTKLNVGRRFFQFGSVTLTEASTPRLSMDFLIRFCQSHETFRLREVEALAALHGIDLKIKEYHPDVSTSLDKNVQNPDSPVSLLHRSPAI
jgi:hypothetical protein